MRKSTVLILVVFAALVGFVVGGRARHTVPSVKPPIPAEYLGRDVMLFGPTGEIKQMTVTRARVGEQYYDYSEMKEGADGWRLEVGGAQITLWGRIIR